MKSKELRQRRSYWKLDKNLGKNLCKYKKKSNVKGKDCTSWKRLDAPISLEEVIK